MIQLNYLKHNNQAEHEKKNKWTKQRRNCDNLLNKKEHKFINTTSTFSILFSINAYKSTHRIKFSLLFVSCLFWFLF